MPTYNGARYLPTALNSLIGQDYPDLEILISDNGSTDETPDVCADYARKDHRVRYLRHRENRGAVWNFRTVLEHARGVFFAWHGDDDLRSPSFVSTAVARLVESNGVLCTTAYQAINMDGSANSLTFEPPLTGGSYAEIIPLMARQRYWADIYGLMRRESLAGIAPRNCWGWDVVFTLEVALRGRVVHEPAAQTTLRLDLTKTSERVAQRSGYELTWNGMMTQLIRATCQAPLPLLERVAASNLLVREFLQNETVRNGVESERGLITQAIRVKRRALRLIGR